MISLVRKRQRWERDELILNTPLENEDGMEMVDAIQSNDAFEVYAAKDLQILIRELPVIERFVIENVFWYDKTERQISELLGTSKQTVNRIKRRALHHLHEEMLGVW